MDTKLIIKPFAVNGDRQEFSYYDNANNSLSWISGFTYLYELKPNETTQNPYIQRREFNEILYLITKKVLEIEKIINIQQYNRAFGFKTADEVYNARILGNFFETNFLNIGEYAVETSDIKAPFAVNGDRQEFSYYDNANNSLSWISGFTYLYELKPNETTQNPYIQRREFNEILYLITKKVLEIEKIIKK